MSMRKIIEGAAKDGSEMAEDVFQLEAEPQEAQEQAEGDREGDQFEEDRHLGHLPLRKMSEPGRAKSPQLVLTRSRYINSFSAAYSLEML